MLNDPFFDTHSGENLEKRDIYLFNADQVDFKLETNENLNIHFVENIDHADIFIFNNGINFLFERENIFDFETLKLKSFFSNIMMYRHLKRKLKFRKTLKQARDDIFSANEVLYFEIFQELIQIQSTTSYEFFSAVLKIPFIKSKLLLNLVPAGDAPFSALFEDYIYIDNEFEVFIELKNDTNSSVFAKLFVHALYEVLNNQFKKQIKNRVSENIQKNHTSLNNLTLDDLIKIFAKLDFPVAVIHNEALVMANELFLKLGVLPSRLSGKSTQEWLEVDDIFYQIKKSQVFELGIIYIFTRVEKRKDARVDHQSDLGIVTGSIAHELNNPVAGILAGLSLLELDEWDAENVQVLYDLKESASRAKGLIETFLSISKYNTKKGESRLIALEVDKALSLLRHRIIESGVNLNVEQLGGLKNRDSHMVVLPIVLYLIFGELLTIFSHKRLVDKSLPKGLSLEIDLVDQVLSIKLKSFELSREEERKFHLKLIEHLMEMDAIKLKVTATSIELLFS